MHEFASSGLDHVDLSDPELFRSGDPHALFRTLRREAPVFWNEERDGPGFWVLSRYADIAAVYQDPSRFSSERGSILRPQRGRPDPAGGKMLVLTDPPRHREVRRVISHAFSPSAIQRLTAIMRESVTGLLEEALALGTFDFATEVAARVPVAMICGMMGVPPEDWNLIFQMTSQAARATTGKDPSGTQAAVVAATAHTEILHYFSTLLHRRRKDPGEDLVSLLASAEVDGAPMTDTEILFHCDNLIVGGDETSRHAASGGLLALMERPASWDALRADPTLIPSAVEEILRWTSPALHALRTAKVDVRLGPTLIQAGEEVTLWNVSANRDEEVFASAATFDIRRSPNRHMAFGTAEHACIGSSLARAELRILFEELVRAVAVVEPAGGAQRQRSNVVAGIEHLPVRFERAGRSSRRSDGGGTDAMAR